MCQQAQGVGVNIQPWHAEQVLDADVVIDALLGIGLNAPVTGVLAEMIEAMNAYDMPVMSLDIPSGIAADTGALCGVAVDADLTVCFIAFKLGLFTGEGKSYAGRVILKHLLQLTPDFYPKFPMA